MVCDPLLYRLGCDGLGVLMTAAAVHKVSAPARFRAVVEAYNVMPSRLVGATSVAIETLELIAGGSLLCGFSGVETAPLWLSAALLSLYALAMAINLRRGNVMIDCGCLGFTTRRPRLHWSMVWRNLAAVCVAIALALLGPGDRAFLWLDWFGLGVGLALLCLLYVALDLASSWVRAEPSP